MSLRPARRPARALALAALAALGGLAALALAAPDAVTHRDGYRLALAPYRFAFPRDHASHPAFRTEWWYYTGHLREAGAAADADPAFGFQLTFFRVGVDTAWRASRSAWAPRDLVFAHLAVTDAAAGRFAWDERIARAALGLAGADTTGYRVWVGDWSVTLAPDGRTHRLRARAAAGARDAAPFGLALDLVPVKPPVAHGREGVSQKSAAHGNASHYYSLTRMRASGRLERGGRDRAVAGEAWMDHEFGTSQLGADQVGWDWFSLQLDDGSELMLYRLRLRDGGVEPLSSGTLVARDGAARHLARDDFAIEAGDARWRSPRTGGAYPARWTLRVPAADLVLEVEPRVADQELVAATAAGAAYWEGLVRVRGAARGRPVRGHGYVELTGYAGAPLRF